MQTLNFNTVLTDGKYNGKTVSEVFNKNPKFVFDTIKKWAINGINDKEFADEVLKEAKITKIVHSETIFQENFCVNRDLDETSYKKLKKDNKTIDQIIEEFDKNLIVEKGRDETDAYFVEK